MHCSVTLHSEHLLIRDNVTDSIVVKQEDDDESDGETGEDGEDDGGDDEDGGVAIGRNHVLGKTASREVGTGSERR